MYKLLLHQIKTPCFFQDNPSCQAFSWRCADSVCELKGSGGTFEEHLGHISGCQLFVYKQILYATIYLSNMMLSRNVPGPRDCACATPHEDLYSGDLTHYLETVKTAGECQVRAHIKTTRLNHVILDT